MKTLELHEEFEMRVLDEMRKIRILDQLIFGGGTMLRLCFELPRYSVDFDFYLVKDRKSFLPAAKKLSGAFQSMGAEVTDETEKHFSFLWEVRMAPFPRRLKIEVRKDPRRTAKTGINIAHSRFVPLQVRLRTLTLEQMWENKIEALLDRQEIRDAYDLEFLTRRQGGRFETIDPKILRKLLQRMESFSQQDFRVKLGGVLEKEDREAVLSHRFSFLRSKLAAALGTPNSLPPIP